MKKLWILLIIAFILAIVFVVPLIHHNRREVPELNPADPQNKPARIVSLSPNLTEILFALGLDEEIVAVSNGSDYPPEAANKKKIGTFWQPDTEAIIVSRPDLVITLWFAQQKAVADSLKRLGYRVLTLKIEKIEELLTAIQKIGAATGKQPEAEELIIEIKNRIFADQQRPRDSAVIPSGIPFGRRPRADLRRATSNERRIKVLWVVQAEPLLVAGRNTFINELIELAGGENAIGPTIAQYPQIGTEEILTCGAEVIIQSAMGTTGMSRQQQAAETFWSKFANLPAVRNNRIYVVESDTILRLGPRLPQGLEKIARCLRPDRNIE